MKKIYTLFGNETLLKVIFAIFLGVYLLFDGILLYLSDWIVANNDRYKNMFEDFMQKGYYESVAQGTSILYNCALQSIYTVAKDVDTSFFILNLFGDLFLTIFGVWFCYKVVGKSKYFYIVIAFYVLKTLTLKSYLRASNDTFLGIFVCLLLYFLIYKIYDQRKQYLTFAFIGLLVSCCLSIRITSVLLLPLVAISFFYWIKNTQISSGKRIKLVSVMVLSTVAFTTALHLPSIIENGKLSYEDKNYYEGANWIQRNYLGLKKIENGQEPIHRDAIWKKTAFPEVKQYLMEHGENSLPDSMFKVIVQDPVLFLKMAVYNLLTCIAEFFRFWMLLLLLPFTGWFRDRFFGVSNLPMVLFVCYLTALSTISFSFLEFRWFIGYEVLIAISALLLLKKPRFSENPYQTNTVIAISLVLVTLVNLKTIISKVYLL